ncbi:MAG TPA: hypothetical protein VEH05_14440 [Streptosporangiaceae bacterium]|nr:hypothetical protein [Streptosporangiaceae bacterium]
MFVREEARLGVGFAAARSALAGLAQGGLLLDASQAAYWDGVTSMAKVGPPGAWPELSKLVMIHLGDMTPHDDSARLALRWEATGPGSSLFPALDADITLTPAGDDATMLTITGVYRPPLGRLGAVLDRAILSRVASATVRDFVARLGAAIEGSSADADQRDVDEHRA